MSNVKPIHDPEEEARLQRVNQKIAAIMKEEDICGYAIIQGRNTTNYIMQLEASWSAITFKPQPDGSAEVRLRALRETGENPEMETKRLNWTMGMLLGFFDQLRDGSDRIGKLLAFFAPKVGPIDHVSAPSPRRPPPTGER